ncbi:MAG: YkgJ family cysteine cluster protein [Haloarculaceae archaeon]
MEVNCEGCAGCCLDWRPLAGEGHTDDDRPGGRGGRYRPLDDTYNLAPVSRDEVSAFLDRGLAGALTPRLFRTAEGPHVTVDGVDLAALDGRPAFVVGLRKVPKPVAPLGADPAWLPTCVFLDPTTLQCRVHDADHYPETCATYPGSNLAVGAETECERVERAGGGDRLLDDDPPDDAAPLFGPAAVGTRVFAHPDAERIADAVGRLADGAPTRADRAEFVAVAAAASPGTLAVNEDRYEAAKARALDATSWVDGAVDEWAERAPDSAALPGGRTGVDGDSEARSVPETPGVDGEARPDPSLAREVEDGRGAPGTPGWE